MLTVTVSRQYRLDPADPTIVQLRTYSTDWRPYVIALDEDDATHACDALQRHEATVAEIVEADDLANAQALIDGIWGGL